MNVSKSIDLVNESLVDALADSLREAEASRVAISPPSASHAELDTATAYAIQRKNIEVRLAAGERIVGHKIGLTSEAMQQQLGVDQPDYGALLDTMVVESGADFAVGALISPRVEAEFAFLIGQDLPPSPSRAELVHAITGVSLAMEIIDSRVADWKISLVDTIADNASSARIVHGEFLPALASRLAALPDTVIRLSRDGVEIGSGPGSAVLGDPVTSLHWLATAIGEFGDGFAAGEIVIAGAVSAAVPLVAGSTWAVSAEGFPSSRFHTTA